MIADDKKWCVERARERLSSAFETCGTPPPGLVDDFWTVIEEMASAIEKLTVELVDARRLSDARLAYLSAVRAVLRAPNNKSLVEHAAEIMRSIEPRDIGP